MTATMTSSGWESRYPTTASWENQYPARTSSRWPAPGIYLNVEMGIAMRPQARTHTASIKYTSKRMEERLHEERIRHQYEQGNYTPDISQHPTILQPANGLYQSRVQERQNRHYQQQHRQRMLGVRPTEQHERGTSAPPTTANRAQPISPISPVSPIGSIHSSYHSGPYDLPSIGPFLSPLAPFTSPQRSTSLLIERSPARTPAVDSPRRAASWERRDQPLPPTPSQFRLGDVELPWSVPPWFRPAEPEFSSPPPDRAEVESRRTDDPQRVRDLDSLQQAMMTVDSLGNDGWEAWTLDSVGDFPRGPRSLGWAVSSNDVPLRPAVSSEPPPYVVSQWEQAFGRSRSNRPRTSGT